MRPGNGTKGFTLAELLVALTILGVIAAFTIPKVLSSQASARSKAVAKEVAGTISSAYSTYMLSNTISSSTGPGSLTPYLNYVKIDTASWMDATPTLAFIDCSSGWKCYVLHNGSVLYYNTSDNFSGTGTTNAINLYVDPDGTFAGTLADGPSKTVQFILYANGRLSTRGQMSVHTCSAGGCWDPDPTMDPSWFGW